MRVSPEYRELSDEELITATRDGDDEAYGELYRRHSSVAKGVALQMGARHEDADDFVAEAFASTLRKLRSGKGPDVFFRGYLLGVVRNLTNRNFGRSSRVELVSEYTGPAEQVVQDDPAARYESEIVRDAFESLPERARLVLWMTEVEGKKPHEITELLGIDANAVAALAYRSRETLRQAYLQSHVKKTPQPDCRKYASQLGALVRSKLSGRRRQQVRSHTHGCIYCTTALHDISEVNQSLRRVIGPGVVGVAGMVLFSETPGEIAAAGTPHAVGPAGVQPVPTQPAPTQPSPGLGSFGAGAAMWAGAAVAALLTTLIVFVMLRTPEQSGPEQSGPIAVTDSGGSAPGVAPTSASLAVESPAPQSPSPSAEPEPGQPTEPPTAPAQTPLALGTPPQASGSIPGAEPGPGPGTELEPREKPGPGPGPVIPPAALNSFQPSGTFGQDRFEPSVATLKVALRPTGNGPVSGVRVVLSLPSGMSYDYVDPGPNGWNCSLFGQTVSCVPASADGRGTNFLRLGVVTSQPGFYPVKISVSGNGWGPNTAFALLHRSRS